jgi:hypothetical protein
MPAKGDLIYMLLNARAISVSVSILCFFVISLIGWFGKLAPFTCCKRALIGAAIAFVTAGFAVRAINTILVSAMIDSHIKQSKEKP